MHRVGNRVRYRARQWCRSKLRPCSFGIFAVRDEANTYAYLTRVKIMKALDIVKIDTGAVGVVTEGSSAGCSVKWFGGAENKVAWWQEGEQGLKVIDSLPSILCETMAHPFGSGAKANPFKDQS